MTETRCGILCHPPCLQRCSGLWAFMTSFGIAIIVTQCSLTYMSTQMTALERQYGLSSAQSGFLYSCNDIGFMMVILVVSFLATKVHIPRFLSCATLLFAASAIICSLPYFILREGLYGDLSNESGGTGHISASRLESLIITDLKQYHELLDSKNMTQSRIMKTLVNNSTQSPSTDIMSYNNQDVNYVAMRIMEQLEHMTKDERATVMQEIVQNGFYSENVPTNIKIILQDTVDVSSSKFSKSSTKTLSRLQLVLASSQVCSDNNTTARQACGAMGSGTKDDQADAGSVSKYTGMAYGILIAGMVLQGVAKSPRMAMGIVFLEDNGSKTQTPMYIGFIFTAFIVGILMAFGLGTVASKLYVTLDDVDIHPMSPQWVGAWWLGFLVIGALAAITAVPLACFPRRLSDKPANSSRRDPTRKRSHTGHLEEFAGTLRRLLASPVYVGTVFMSMMQLLWAGGYLPFAPKYVETQFSMPAWQANMIVGLANISCALFGTLLTGFYLTRRRTHPVTMLKLGIAFVTCSIVLSLLNAFWFGCETPTIVGYNDRSSSSRDNGTLGAMWREECSVECHCDDKRYFPVCVADGVSYFSACHAGCRATENMGFTNCTCSGAPEQARPGLCPTNCRMLVPFLVTASASNFLWACISVIILVVKLRAVADKDRAMAIGCSAFLNNLLGWVPGPIIFGKLLDNTCSLWNESCTQKGSCAIYDIVKFRYSVNLLYIAISTVVVATMCFVLYKAKQKSDWNMDVKLLQPSGSIKEKDGEETIETLMANSPETKV